MLSVIFQPGEDKYTRQALFSVLGTENITYNIIYVTVLKPKQKTAVLRWNRTAIEPWFSGGHVMVFSNFKNGPARSQTSPNNSLIIASAGLLPAPFEVTDWPPGVELPAA